MIRRRSLVGGLLASNTALAHIRPARAAPRRLGWLTFGPPPLAAIDRSLVDALAQRGLRDGEAIAITYRHAHGEVARLASLARELVAAAPDVLVCIGGDLVHVLQEATTTIPIVAGVSDDPVRSGTANSYARPGRNFTGVAFLTDEMAGKRLQLLREALPDVKHVGVIWNPQHLEDEMANVRAAARTLGLMLASYEVSDPGHVKAAFLSIEAAGIDCLFVIPSRFTIGYLRPILEFAQLRRLPVVGAWREFTDGGGLLSYGPNRRAESRVLAAQIERILKGDRAADIPIQRPTIFELVVNQRAAARLGRALPQSLLQAADEVIE